MRITIITSVAGAFLLIAMGGFASAQSESHTTDPRSDEERQLDRAEDARRATRDQAMSRLGYPSIDPYLSVPVRQYDFIAISRQIARLAASLSVLSVQQSTGLGPGPAPLASSTMPVAGIYGPAGPTVRSVRAYLEYRIVMVGNLRLKVGEVVDKGDEIIAEVVTQDGSLVEKYTVNKKKGNWSIVNE